MSAMPAFDPAHASTGARLVSVDGRELPLRSVAVDADAGGGLCRVRLRQTFVNPYDEPLAATYLLPLPADGAVVDFAFTLDGRRIVGRVAGRDQARAAFDQAVLEGRTAALLEQDRTALFTQELGNLPPGAEVHVDIDVEQLLRWVEGGWEWRWPTVVGPRYLSASGVVPDAERVTVDVADGPLAVACSAAIRIADAVTGAPRSPSHPLWTDGPAVGLTGALDRDVVVRWPVAALTPGVRIETARPDGDADAYALVTVVPPEIPSAPVSRDLCLLLDTSGSMGGAPLAQLQRFSTALIGGLRPGDRLEMISFSSTAQRWSDSPTVIDDRTRATALAWVARLRAGGGTEMHQAVIEAMRPLRSDAARQVVLMTDGYIGFEQQVIGQIRRDLPPGSRVHVVGVGSSVNRTLTAGVARAGAGHEAIVGPDEDVTHAVEALLARTSAPLWVDVAVTGTAVREVAPARVADLCAGSPTRIAVRIAPHGGTLVVTARTATGTDRREMGIGAIPTGSGRRVVATRFARERVEDLELGVAAGEPSDRADAAIEALGLQYRIATRRTSWIAETDEPTVDAGLPTRREAIPHVLPYGVSAEGVGLRPATAAGPLLQASPAGMARRAGVGGQSVSGDARSAYPAAVPAVVARGRAAESKKERAQASRDAAPPPPKAAPAPEPVMDWLAEEAVEREEAAKPQAPSRTVRARIVSTRDGKLVVEFTAEETFDWDPREILVNLGGRATPMPPLIGTTRAARVAAGQVVRVVVVWSGPTPASLSIHDLTLILG